MRTRVYRVSRVPEGGSVGGPYVTLKPTCSLAWAYSSTAEYVAYSLPGWPCGEFACEVAFSEYAEFPRGGRPRARPSALLGAYSALLGPGPAASSHARSPERVRRVPEGGSPPGPAQRPRAPLLAHRPPRGPNAYSGEYGPELGRVIALCCP